MAGVGTKQGEKVNFMSATAIPNNASATVLKAVIIYDDFDSATRATALLERVGRRADEAIQWDLKPWRFEVLKRPALAALTVAVAANADLIVLALGRKDSTRAELLDWLKNWAENRRIADAALLALPSGEFPTPSASWDELAAFAEAQGLMFLDPNGVGHDGNRAPHDGRWRRRSVTARPARMADADRLPLPSHWGINE